MELQRSDLDFLYIFTLASSKEDVYKNKVFIEQIPETNEAHFYLMGKNQLLHKKLQLPFVEKESLWVFEVDKLFGILKTFPDNTGVKLSEKGVHTADAFYECFNYDLDFQTTKN